MFFPSRMCYNTPCAPRRDHLVGVPEGATPSNGTGVVGGELAQALPRTLAEAESAHHPVTLSDLQKAEQDFHGWVFHYLTEPVQRRPTNDGKTITQIAVAAMHLRDLIDGCGGVMPRE